MKTDFHNMENAKYNTGLKEAWMAMYINSIVARCPGGRIFNEAFDIAPPRK